MTEEDAHWARSPLPEHRAQEIRKLWKSWADLDNPFDDEPVIDAKEFRKGIEGQGFALCQTKREFYLVDRTGALYSLETITGRPPAVIAKVMLPIDDEIDLPQSALKQLRSAKREEYQPGSHRQAPTKPTDREL